MDKIAVLIPCYNEEQTVYNVVKDYKKALPEATIYVYDNNSKDNTVKEAKRAGAIVRYERKQGKGNVMRTMFREIDAQCYIMVDGDDTYPATKAREIADLVLEKNADMVIGDRLSSTYFTENKRLFHNTGNRLVRRMINTIYKTDVKDIMTGLRGFSYRFVKTFPVLSKGFEIETEMTLHCLDKNLNVENVVIEYKDRPDGSVSKLNTYGDGFKVIKTIIVLFKKYKPLKFFNILAFITLLLGIIFNIPILNEYFKTGLVPRMPTYVTSLFLFMISLLFFVCGLILDNMAREAKQSFELELNKREDVFKELIEKEYGKEDRK